MKSLQFFYKNFSPRLCFDTVPKLQIPLELTKVAVIFLVYIGTCYALKVFHYSKIFVFILPKILLCTVYGVYANL